MTTPFTIAVGLRPGQACLSLHGRCTGPQAKLCLQNALRAACLTRDVREVWLDCQHLAQLDEAAQQALRCAHQTFDLAGVPLYVCGLPPLIRAQLDASHLADLLHLRAAQELRGPLPVVSR